MMQIKQKLKNSFNHIHLKLNEKKYLTELDKHFGDFFPSKNFVMQNLSNLSMQDRKYKFVYNVIHLPFHTRDVEWLTNYIMDKIQKTPRLSVLSDIPYNTLKRYVETSSNFIARRNQYEKDLVCGYINNWLHECCDDYYLKAEQKQKYEKKRNFDEIFREKVVNAISLLGIDSSIVNLYLEESAHMWRKCVMQKTFMNRLQNSSYFKQFALNDDQRILLSKNNPQVWEKFVNKEFDFMNLWLAVREVKYYQQNKRVVDKAGTITPAMQLIDYKVYRLRDEKSSMRFEYIQLLKEAAQIVQEIESQNYGKSNI